MALPVDTGIVFEVFKQNNFSIIATQEWKREPDAHTNRPFALNQTLASIWQQTGIQHKSYNCVSKSSKYMFCQYKYDLTMKLA